MIAKYQYIYYISSSQAQKKNNWENMGYQRVVSDYEQIVSAQ